MSANLGDSSARALRASLGYLRAEFGFATVTEIAEIYRGVAVSCMQGQITRVLIVIGDDEPAGERALRDAATMMVLAGVPTGFRLALIAAEPRVMRTYRNAQHDLSAAGVTTQLFGSEEPAVRWLEG